MKRSLAFLALPLAALTGLSLVACGDDDDDEPEATVADTDATGDTEPPSDTEATDDTSTEITLPDISVPDISLPGGTLPGGITVPDFTIPDISLPGITVPDMTELLGQIFPGLDDTQLQCLADGLGDVTEVDTAQVMDLLDDCNIQASDIIGGD